MHFLAATAAICAAWLGIGVFSAYAHRRTRSWLAPEDHHEVGVHVVFWPIVTVVALVERALRGIGQLFGWVLQLPVR